MDPDFFYYGFARSGRTTLFEKWYGHGRTSRSGCYAPEHFTLGQVKTLTSVCNLFASSSTAAETGETDREQETKLHGGTR